MANQPGLSWGPRCPINALRTSRGWLLIDFSGGARRVVARVPKREGIFALMKVHDLGAKLNYGDQLPPLADIDATP